MFMSEGDKLEMPQYRIILKIHQTIGEIVKIESPEPVKWPKKLLLPALPTNMVINKIHRKGNVKKNLSKSQLTAEKMKMQRWLWSQ